MIKYLKGILGGNKLAKQSASMCMNIVNYLIQNGYDVRMPDTASILKECYAICHFSMIKQNEKPETLGSRVLQAQEILKDWLIKVFKSSYPNYEYSSAVDDVMKSLPEYSDKWIAGLLEEHPELKTQPLIEWMPSAASHFAMNIGEYATTRFGSTPNNFDAVLIGLTLDLSKIK